MPANAARFIKNLNYDISDTSNSNTAEGGQTGVGKPIQSNEKYVPNLVLPDGYNQEIGSLSFKETKEVFVFIYNDHFNHTIYRINGLTQTIDIVYQGALLNFQLDPEHFIQFGAAWLEVIYLTDPNTGNKLRRSFLFYVDGFNYNRCIAVEDSIATRGFNDQLFPYFSGNYDRTLLINMGVPTPHDCMDIQEVKPDLTVTENNRLLFQTWQFRITCVDVWGRPSEHGIISNQYLPGAGNCNPSSTNLARCLNLIFDAPSPYINSIQIEYRKCNSDTWYIAETINLYVGSFIGEWWKRIRNPDINFNSSTHKITYQFCADKECEIVPPAEIARLDNPLPRVSYGVTKIDKFIELSNNKDGFLPSSKELNDKIKIVVTSPTNADPANSELRNITVLVEIWNTHFGSQPIFRQGITGSGDLAYGFGQYGGINTNRAFFAYKQYFKNPNQQGFVGYLAGTDAYTISTQWLLDETTGSFTQITKFTDLKIAIPDDGFRYFQRFDFTNIPKGKYIFRIAGHGSDPNVDKNYQSTSTTVWGQFYYVWRSGNNPRRTPDAVNDHKELVIDVCSQNYDSRLDNKILTIFDTVDGSQVAQTGYIKNTDEADELQYGIELAQITVTGGGQINGYSNYTDHNGFYWIAGVVNNALDNNRYTYRIYAACNCQFGEQFRGKSGTSPQLFTDDYVMNKSNCQDYANEPCNFIKITGQVKGCGTTTGIPNVGVVLSRGMATRTDENGFYTIIAHDDIRFSTRQDSVYFITNSCGFTDCNNNCIEPYDITITQCITCADRIINVPDRFVAFFDVVKGLLSGGVYPVGYTRWDWLGRATFVQTLGNIKIPSFQDTKVFAPSTLSVTIAPDAVFPIETEYITFWIGAETTIEDYETWIVDKAEFIDNTGLVNEVSPTQIKIYYASLLEYSKRNNLNTTVNWGFVSTATNLPVLNDRVDFLLNGNGDFFGKYVTAIVKYDQVGQYFLINYTNDLKDLKSNALIRLWRPKECTGNEGYFEIPCSTVNIINRHAEVFTINLNAYDTYYQKREIPVPVLQTAANPTAVPPIPADIFVNELRILGTPFEHKSVSDFWGKNCWNIGRVNVKNPYETELYHRDQLALSGALSTTGTLNYLCYFDTSRKYSFDENGLNGIVSVIAKTGKTFILGQSNNIIVGFNDNIMRVNANGEVVVPSRDQLFGNPTLTSATNSGCLMFDKNTIYEKDGLIQFLDVTKTWLMQSNFQITYPISINGAQGYLLPKIKDVQQYNLTHINKRYFTSVVNPASMEYLLSDYIIRSGSFVNQEREFNVTLPETLSFGIHSKMFKGCYSYIGEGYAELEGEKNDQQLFSFKYGIPYRHYTTSINKTYNNFFGIQCESSWKPVIVMDGFKKKRPLAIAEYCKQGVFFSDKVTTETGQISRILISGWNQADYGFFAPFLCDINTLFDTNIPNQTGVNKLFDGNQLVGVWVEVRLISEPKISNKYFEFQGIICEVFGIEKSG